jgi:hypothetical protein
MTMRYLALLGDDESNATQPGTPEWDAEMEGYERFGAVAGEAIVAGEALEAAATATTVRHAEAGEPLVTTGPFAETSEAIGGFYILDAGTLDDAIELVRHIPAVDSGWVALRPVVQWFGPGEADSSPPPGTARYLAVLYGKESPADVPDTPEWEAGATEHGRFVEGAGPAVLAGVALHPLDTTTTVRVRDGETLVTDGPFSESAEIVGGFYVVAAESPERAAELAAAIPVNPAGSVELRPIMELG